MKLIWFLFFLKEIDFLFTIWKASVIKWDEKQIENRRFIKCDIIYKMQWNNLKSLNFNSWLNCHYKRPIWHQFSIHIHKCRTCISNIVLYIMCVLYWQQTHSHSFSSLRSQQYINVCMYKCCTHATVICDLSVALPCVMNNPFPFHKLPIVVPSCCT